MAYKGWAEVTSRYCWYRVSPKCTVRPSWGTYTMYFLKGRVLLWNTNFGARAAERERVPPRERVRAARLEGLRDDIKKKKGQFTFTRT